MKEKLNIAVVGAGYVGLSVAVLLSQNHVVRALDIVAAKVKKINARQVPIEDQGLTDYLANKPLQLEATLDKAEVVQDLESFKQRADLIVTNRLPADWKNVQHKVYTRDLFGQD